MLEKQTKIEFYQTAIIYMKRETSIHSCSSKQIQFVNGAYLHIQHLLSFLALVRFEIFYFLHQLVIWADCVK